MWESWQTAPNVMVPSVKRETWRSLFPKGASEIAAHATTRRRARIAIGAAALKDLVLLCALCRRAISTLAAVQPEPARVLAARGVFTSSRCRSCTSCRICSQRRKSSQPTGRTRCRQQAPAASPPPSSAPPSPPSYHRTATCFGLRLGRSVDCRGKQKYACWSARASCVNPQARSVAFVLAGWRTRTTGKELGTTPRRTRLGAVPPVRLTPTLPRLSVRCCCFKNLQHRRVPVRRRHAARCEALFALYSDQCPAPPEKKRSRAGVKKQRVRTNEI